MIVNGSLSINDFIKKSNLFTNIRETKENYAVNLFVDVVLPENKNITIVDGDYYTTDEYLSDILSTIEIRVDDSYTIN